VADPFVELERLDERSDCGVFIIAVLLVSRGVSDTRKQPRLPP